MTALRVYAHHGPVPAGFLVSPIPAQLPGRDDPPPVAQYWCELVKQTLVDTPDGSAVGYGQQAAAPPDEYRWDMGYDPAGVDFHVGRVCVLLVGAASNDDDYVLVSPQGERFQVPAGLEYAPMQPMPQWGDPEAPYEGLQGCWSVNAESAKGVWLIEVFPKAGYAGVPVNGYWANEVSNVQLDGTPAGGFLALEFTGDVVLSTTTTTTTPAPTTTTTTPAPTTTTTTPAPTTTTTTPAPTTTTTTPAPTTTTTTTTTTPPPRRDLGLLGVTALLLALVLTAAAAINLFIWACSGYFRVGLVAAGLSLAVAALAVTPLWVVLWWDGAVVRTLADWIARLAAGTPVIAAVFAVFGNFDCAGGALILAGLFGILLAAVHLANRVAERREDARQRRATRRLKLRRKGQQWMQFFP